MTRGTQSPQHETLYNQLRILARDRAVWRADLADLLDADLCDLRDFWEIDTDSHRPIDHLRADVSNALKKHFDGIPPRMRRRAKWRGKDRAEFKTVFYASFNIFDQDFGNLAERTKRLRISGSASQRELILACDEIAKQILASGYIPKMVAQREQGDATEQLEESPHSHLTGVIPGELVKSSPREPVVYRHYQGQLQRSIDNDQRDYPTGDGWSFLSAAQPRPRRRLVILATVAFLVIATGGMLWWAPWQPTSSEAAHSGQPVDDPNRATSATGEASVPAQPLPFHIDSVAHVPTGGAGYTYAFREKLQLNSTDLQSLTANEMGSSQYRNWMLDRGGVVSNDNATQIILRGTLPQPVVIANLRLIKQCESFLTGALLYSPGAGQDENIEIGFNLDESPSVAQIYQRGSLEGHYFDQYTVELAQGETKTLVVHAMTNRQYCEYYFELDVTTGQGSNPAVVKIDDNGKPFRVSATPGFDNSLPKFGDYQELYAGGVANIDGWAQEDPNTYSG